MSLCSRIEKSLRNGTFVIKLINRFSRTKYIQVSGESIDQYLADHYPGDAWRSLSWMAKQVWAQFSWVFQTYQIHTIAYVGANVGKTALALDEAFPGIQFYLLEPVPETFEVLVRNTENRENMHCLPLAAGAKEGRRQMLVGSYSQANSLLPYTPLALQEYRQLGNQVTVEVL